MKYIFWSSGRSRSDRNAAVHKIRRIRKVCASSSTGVPIRLPTRTCISLRVFLQFADLNVFFNSQILKYSRGPGKEFIVCDKGLLWPPVLHEADTKVSAEC